MKRALFVLFVVAVVAAIALGLWRNPGEQPRAVYAARAETVTFERTITADGYLRADRRQLAFPQPGVILQVFKHAGDRVKRGEVIARLADDEARRQLALAEARLAAFEEEERANRRRRALAREKLLRKQSELKRKLDLVRALYQAGAQSLEDLQAAQDALAENARALTDLAQQAAAQAAQAESRRAELKAALEAAREALRQRSLRAPTDGVLEEVPFRPGEVARGAAVLVVAGSLRPYARFPEAEGKDLRPGLPARIVFADGSTYPSRVARVLPPEREQDVAWIPATFAPLPPGTGAPDLSITAHVVVERIENAVVVPLEALVEMNGRFFVWTVREGRAHRIGVEKRAQNLTQAAVRGVSPGTVVLRLPPEDLKEGQRVRPVFEEDGGAG